MRKFRILVGLAFRNLGRSMRRTLLTALAMIVGGALLMISLPIGDGTHEAWIESGVRMGSGHLSIESPEYQSNRKLEARLSAQARADAEAALEDPQMKRYVLAASPQLALSGLASSAAGARPASIVAVRPDSEANFGILDDKLVEGRYLRDDDRLSAYVGQGLAESLELRIGSRLVLTAQDANGEVTAQLARVVGIFRSGVPELDQSVVHIPLSTAGAWLGTGEDVTRLAVLVRKSRDVDPLRRELEERLAGPMETGDLAVVGWREAMPELDAAVRIDDFGNYLMQGILFTIIALGIVNTVLMSVLHRYREFGVLQALGLTPLEAGSLVLVEGLLLTALSGAIGIGLGLFITWFFWRDGLDFSAMMSEEWSFSGVVLDPVVVPLFSAERVVQAMVFILIIGGLASFYPAFRAARIDVTESMKFER